MRHAIGLAFLSVLIVAAASAQNTDIEALAGLQFNFGNPGARSLGMGGAFIGLADDASAADANPAGLTILRKPEASIEARQSTTAQRFVTGGTYPYVTRADINARQTSVSFASVVFPASQGVLAFYYHRPLSFRNDVDLTSRYDTPVFYFGANGPVSRAQCATDPSCSERRIYPFSTSADLQMETYGVAVARAWKSLSFGAAARYHRFQERAIAMRRDIDLPGQPLFVIRQTNGSILSGEASDKDVTFVGGVKWTVSPQLSFGMVYKDGASFPAPVAAAPSVDRPVEIVGLTEFHVPATFGVGAAYRPIPNLTVTADLDRVHYSHLTDHFVSVIEYGSEDIEQVTGYRSQDGTEIHAGLEYFLLTRVPFAIRGGWWRDPAHSIRYTSQLRTVHDMAAAILFPGSENENHYSVGVGLAWPRFQLDAAYDHARSMKTASVSVIARY